jgi:hypothetical protein
MNTSVPANIAAEIGLIAISPIGNGTKSITIWFPRQSAGWDNGFGACPAAHEGSWRPFQRRGEDFCIARDENGNGDMVVFQWRTAVAQFEVWAVLPGHDLL